MFGQNIGNESHHLDMSLKPAPERGRDKGIQEDREIARTTLPVDPSLYKVIDLAVVSVG